jgi:hypothetical protein
MWQPRGNRGEVYLVSFFGFVVTNRSITHTPESLLKRPERAVAPRALRDAEIFGLWISDRWSGI